MMRKPANSGTLFYNYKGRFSSLLLAVSDYQHRFIYAWVGNYGHDSDGGLYDRFARPTSMLSWQCVQIGHQACAKRSRKSDEHSGAYAVSRY